MSDMAILRAVEEATAKVEAVKIDPSIPIRSNKKTGAKSKKQVREEIQLEATEKLKEISVRNGYVAGKWLIFASAEKVDMLWSNISKSLVSGPLASTVAYLAKVATLPEEENPTYQHLICVYVPDVYNRDVVTEVMKVLLRNHGVNLSGVKSDLYTSIGIDSKHPSGIQSTIWKNSALLNDSESKELKDAFFANLTAGTTSASDKSKGALDAPISSKGKLKLKAKAVDDPFASDDDHDDEDENIRRQEIKASLASKRKQSSDSGDESDRPKKKSGR